jgi:hypothetical protein
VNLKVRTNSIGTTMKLHNPLTFRPGSQLRTMCSASIRENLGHQFLHTINHYSFQVKCTMALIIIRLESWFYPRLLNLQSPMCSQLYTVPLAPNELHQIQSYTCSESSRSPCTRTPLSNVTRREPTPNKTSKNTTMRKKWHAYERLFNQRA